MIARWVAYTSGPYPLMRDRPLGADLVWIAFTIGNIAQ